MSIRLSKIYGVLLITTNYIKNNGDRIEELVGKTEDFKFKKDRHLLKKNYPSFFPIQYLLVFEYFQKLICLVMELVN